MMSAAKTGAEASLKVEFDAACAQVDSNGAGAVLRLPLPRLAGNPAELVLPRVRAAGEAQGFRLFERGGLLFGCAVQPVAGALEECARRLYRRLLQAAGGRSIYRIWNYVPDINRITGGLENYRAFNAGRVRAFEEAHGAGYRRFLPAASAVGCAGDSIAVLFAAGTASPRHFENPEQVPAYDYPAEHGPRPPSFSRATVAGHGGGDLIFVSGTAAIKGHRTLASRDLQDQLDCTLDNLRLISRAAGAGDDLGASAGFGRHLTIYLRRPADLPAAELRLRSSLLKAGDSVVWLQADLCRAALAVEIEASLFRSPPAGA